MSKTRKIKEPTREDYLKDAESIIATQGSYVVYHTQRGDVIFVGVNKRNGISLIELNIQEYGRINRAIGAASDKNGKGV